MGTLRRFTVGLVAAAALLIALPPAASAEDVAVSGPFTATGQLLGGCGVFRQIVDGGGEWTGLGTSTFHLDFCLGSNPGNDQFPADGTFTVTAPDGTLTGDLGGTIEAAGDGSGIRFPLHLVLSATGGTGRYAGATGVIAMEGFFGPGAFHAEGTVDGTVTLAPRTPATVDDCMDGGWRDHVDEQGEPFRNQGQCVAWVRHHT